MGSNEYVLAFPCYTMTVLTPYDAISVFAKNSKAKQNLNYLIGMVRHWSILGKWSMPTTEDQQLIEVFKQEIRIEPSVETRQIIIRMVSKYGSIKLSQYMTKVFNDKTELDISELHIQRVVDLLENSKHKNISPLGGVFLC
ncbi:hypothetical protein SBF1_7890004 [Candidatus Desulfosporosinus infrequens]|uniref:Uncharacterized protein n=1 Tax=Candidatus Desulfosporosinus infrequens TaxID=2043169 RepID=A0A2U3LS80_9FIRM|nr:hypothetical protein SBF1_7890004 [Candidatus Desulfosporosinus infrequens]